METIFSASSLLVMPFWFLMILLPTWAWTRRIVASPLMVVPAALLYAALVVPGLSTLYGQISGGSLDSIARLLGTPEGATVAWVHFLAFDLFVGRWAYLDARERRVHPLIMAPVLFVILMFGPLGFLLYLGVRALVPARVARPTAANI